MLQVIVALHKRIINGTLIPPSDTVILYIKDALVDGGDISINDKYVFYGGQNCNAIYGDSLNCFKYPSDFRFMENYENKKDNSPKTTWS